MDRKKNWKNELVLHGRQDPAWWIESVLGDSLWSRQKDICQSIVEHERTAVVACVDRDTEILTELRGFQLFKDLKPGDKVATLVEGKMEFVLPTAYHEYDYDGELIGIKSKSIDCLITPNHRCLVQSMNQGVALAGPWQIKLAEDLYGKTTHRFTSDFIWEGIETTIDEKIYEFFGFFCGDGYAEERGYGIRISQKHYVDYVEDLVSHFADTFDTTYRKQKQANGYDFILPGRNIWELIVNDFGRLKSERRIPQWLKDSKPTKLRAFLKGFMLADGSGYNESWEHHEKGKTPSVRIYYETLANAIQEIGMRAGFSAYLRKIKYVSGYTGKTGIGWYVAFGQRGKNPWPLKRSWYKQCYQDKVYCVTVPSGIICIRRKGVYHWSGNSFGIGKTMLAARLALWFLCCFKPSKIITTAPTLRQVKDLLWSELRNAHKKAIFPIGGELLQLSLKFDEDHFCVGFSTDAENIDRFTGFHQSNLLVIFDQAGGIDPNIWEASEGLMTSANCKWLAISNSAISTGELANICMPDRRSRFGTWNVLKVKASESPNVVAGKNLIPGLVAHDWVKKREEAWGRDDPLYKIFVEAEFIPDSEMVVVPYKAIVDAFNINGELGSHIEVGLDVARMGTDSTVWTAVSGSRVMEVKRVTGNTTMQVVGLTVEFVKHLQETYGLPVTAVKIDVIGLGAGVYDRLIELDDDNIEIPVVAVNNAEVNIVVDKERYSNVRAEMAWAFRHRIDHGNVGLAALQVHDYEIKEYIRGDIQAMRYKITSQGKIQLLPKEELKKNLGRSPDYWDSLVMAFETPGGGPPMLESISSKKERDDEFSITEEEWQILMGTRMPMDDRFFREVQF